MCFRHRLPPGHHGCAMNQNQPQHSQIIYPARPCAGIRCVKVACSDISHPWWGRLRWSLEGWFVLNQLVPVTYACRNLYEQLRVYCWTVWILYGWNLKSSFKFLKIPCVCHSEFVCFLQMKRCVLCAEFCGICDVFLRMNVARCAMCGVKDAASLSSSSSPLLFFLSLVTG